MNIARITDALKANSAQLNRATEEAAMAFYTAHPELGPFPGLSAIPDAIWRRMDTV